MSATCGYRPIYRAPCTNPKPCHHSNLTCERCGAPATGDCYETIMSMYCGQPLCDTCTCTHKAKDPTE